MLEMRMVDIATELIVNVRKNGTLAEVSCEGLMVTLVDGFSVFSNEGIRA